jgi:hypothetical protein
MAVPSLELLYRGTQWEIAFKASKFDSTKAEKNKE